MIRSRCLAVLAGAAALLAAIFTVPPVGLGRRPSGARSLQGSGSQSPGTDQRSRFPVHLEHGLQSGQGRVPGGRVLHLRLGHQLHEQSGAPANGRWSVTRSTSASYKTRLIVYRPSNPKKFNGTVVVEWLNVSVGSDTAPDWIGDHTELIRQGFAYVGVSAQAIGVNGGTAVLGAGSKGLAKTNPARYGTLHHPGDAYSYDIFSQAAQAIWHPRRTSVLGGLKPKALIADGESQSAFFLTHIHRRHRSAGPRLQRVFHPQPVERRHHVVGIARLQRPRAVPDRPPCPGHGLRDRDRPDAGLRP